MKYSFLYLMFIVALNVGFSVFHPIALSNGDVWPPMSLFVGIVFVLRDFSQKEIGHKVFFVMAIGAIISYFMASPFVAIASLSAYVVSEILDWYIYSFSKMTINKRILISSIISCPIDSFVFLVGISSFSTSALVIMTLSKFVGIFVLLLFRKFYK